MPLNDVMFSSDQAEWETPPWLYHLYGDHYKLNLDVCATPANAKCADFFTPEQDGLAQDWTGRRVWMNPPYGRHIGRWVRKAFLSRRSAEIIVMLVPARTDTRWWHEYIASDGTVDIAFLRGRIHFLENGVRSRSGAPFPSAVVTMNNSYSAVGRGGWGQRITWADFRDIEATYERNKDR